MISNKWNTLALCLLLAGCGTEAEQKTMTALSEACRGPLEATLNLGGWEGNVMKLYCPDTNFNLGEDNE